MQLTAVYLAVPKGYIAFVQEVPGANMQGDTLGEAREMGAIEINQVLPHRSLDAIRTVPGVIGARRREHNDELRPGVEPRRPRGEKPVGFVGAEVDTSCGVEPRRSGGEKPLGRVTKNRSDIELRNVH
jgi:predicted RNase H-like HicB family nuclease